MIRRLVLILAATATIACGGSDKTQCEPSPVTDCRNIHIQIGDVCPEGEVSQQMTVEVEPGLFEVYQVCRPATECDTQEPIKCLPESF